MALSTPAAARWQKFTFLSADSTPDVTNMQLVELDGGDCVPTGAVGQGDQALRVTATCNGSSGSASLIFCLVDRDDDATPSSLGGAGEGIFAHWTATATATAYRTNHDGGAGDYLCSVAFALNTSTDTLDLNGIGKSGKFPRLYVGCLSFSTITSVYVRVCATRSV